MRGIDRKRKANNEHPDSEGTWAISYGDMITLLLAFFVLFFTVDPQKESEENLQESLFMTLADAAKTQNSDGNNSHAGTAESKRLPAAVMNIGDDKSKDNIEKQLIEDWGASIHKVGNKIIVDFPRISFFDFAKVRVTEDGERKLANFVKLYMPYAGSYVLGIRAYTDTRPVRSSNPRFKDNLELSALRSVAAMRVLQKQGIPLDRMKLGGYGELNYTYNALKDIADKSGQKQMDSFARRVILVIEPPDKEVQL